MGHLGPWYESVSPVNRYLFNGLEREGTSGLNIDIAFFRSYDPALGRWLQLDPALKHRESPYAGFAGNPVAFSDFLGADTLRQIGPDTYYGGYLDGPTVSAKRSGNNYDQSLIRYGYNGTFYQWQHAYGFQGWSYDNALNYWQQVYSADFDRHVRTRDSLEANRAALEKLWFFAGGFGAIAQVYGLGGIGTRLPATRGFSFTSPVAAAQPSVYGYFGLDPLTKQIRYVGISNNPPTRWGVHKRAYGTGKESLDYSIVPGARFNSKFDARIWEQRQINAYGLNNLLNARNEIARRYWVQYGVTP